MPHIKRFWLNAIQGWKPEQTGSSCLVVGAIFSRQIINYRQKSCGKTLELKSVILKQTLKSKVS